MTINFNYKTVMRSDSLGIEKVPAIPITVLGKFPLQMMGFVDSGADYCALPLYIAQALDLDLSSPPEHILGISGHAKAIKTKMKLRLWKNHERYVFTVDAYAIDGTWEDFPLLIGRKDFFDRFKITFIEKHKKLRLKRHFN